MSLVIGINSGSSFDGVDAVLMEISIGADGLPTRPKFIAGNSYDWPEEIAKKVLKSFENELSVFDLTRLNYEAGAVYAEATRSILRETGHDSAEISVVGFDGQTIYQEPPVHSELDNYRNSESIVSRWSEGAFAAGLQIGEPAVVAGICNIPVVSQFRPSDHALGGTGAPLMQFLDYVAFRDLGPTLTLNIGGIANCQLAHPDRAKMMAFDTGPGNVMIDHAVNRLLGLPYDDNGSLARSGTILPELLAELKDHDFFTRPVPRSAWRLDFGSQFADAILDKHSNESAADLLATFTEFSAFAIADSIGSHVAAIDQFTTLIASGGGVRNSFLVERLQANLPTNLKIVLSDEFGIPAAFKEAIKFGTLAFANIHGIANNIPAASGASEFTILGKFVNAPRFARVS